jgi:glycosyltransferase involved in cell wall biosynthesis
MKNYTISVVIPSIGGDLCGTLDSINAGRIYPDEIIICLPNDTHSVQDVSKYKNLTIIYAQQYGQVYQRIVGFECAKGDYVLQLDDDVILENNSIEQLLNCLKMVGGRAAIAPAYFKMNTNISLYKEKNASLLRRVVYWVANGSSGFEPGIVSLSGINFGLNFDIKTQNINKSDWLPGGCVLHNRENLIMDDYFPFKGKAYSEDLIHSFILKKRGVNLYVCNKSVVYTKTDGIESLQELYKQYKISKYVNSIWGRSLTRLKAYYLIRLIFFFLKKAKV